MTDPIESYFPIEPLDEAELETPVPVIDLDIAERNLRRWQERCDKLGLANKPHIKTHKMVGMARFQLALGAQGITVQKLGEAEVMADAGIDDMRITYNVVGAPKLRRLAALARRTSISVVADNPDVVAGLGQAGREAGREIAVLVECDTGAGRNGVSTPQAAAALARTIADTEGLRYGGLMTYPAVGTRRAAADFLTETIRLAAADGLPTEVVSSGGSPEMASDEGLEPVTEYRAGTYVYFDRSMIRFGACTLADCALRVRAMVVSVPAPDRAILDAGSKALTSDLLMFQDFGCVPELGGAPLYKLNEEHGHLDISRCETKPRVGDVLAVLPNHACAVTNMFDRVALTKGDRLLGLTRVDARGRVW